MSYRNKTCAYCNGDHAILDCTKLVADAKKAQEKLDQINNDPDAWRKEAIVAHAKAVFYQTVNIDRDPQDRDRYLVTNYDPVNDPNIKSRLVQNVKDSIRWRVSDTYFTSEQVEEYLDPNIFDTFDLSLSYEDRWNLRNSDDGYRPQRYTSVIHRHQEVQEAVAKRAKKSCSYCRGEGHTVRTCSQKKTDHETYHNVYKIASYLTAQACARFGLWTSSMLKKEGDIYTFRGLQGDPFFFTSIIGNDKISTEDLTDCIYALAVLERSQFRKPQTSGYYGDTTRFNFEISRHFLKFFNLKDNAIDLSQRDDEDPHINNSNLGSDFYPAHIGMEHIFLRLMERCNMPQPKKERYSSAEIGVADVGTDFFNEESRYRSHVWIRSSDLYDRKKRYQHTWEKMEKFVNEHKDILAKAEEILNKN